MPAPLGEELRELAFLVPLTDNMHWQGVLNTVIQDATSSDFSGLLVSAFYFWIAEMPGWPGISDRKFGTAK